MPAADRPAPRRAVAALAAAAALLALGLLAAGPIPLPARYHDFADRAPIAGIPNAFDVLSNAALLAAGLWGLARSRGAALPWRVFFAAVALAAPASAYYHWAPDDARLAVDRLPIAWAAVALACAFVAERVDARAARAGVVAAALALATASVVHAYLSLRWLPPGGDLRAYLLLQLWPLVLIPLFVGALPRPRGGVRDLHWCLPMALYLAAKAVEAADASMLAATGVVSGHTLKHLLAAAAAAWLAFAVGRR